MKNIVNKSDNLGKMKLLGFFFEKYNLPKLTNEAAKKKQQQNKTE